MSSILAAIPALLGQLFTGLMTYIGLKNTPAEDAGQTASNIAADNTKNADDVQKDIASGDISDIQDKGDVK